MISSYSRVLPSRLLTSTLRRTHTSLATAAACRDEYDHMVFSQLPGFSPSEFSLWSLPTTATRREKASLAMTCHDDIDHVLFSQLPRFAPSEFSLWSLNLEQPLDEASSTVASVTAAKALPRTLAQALAREDVPLVVTTATAPHRIVHVNKAWGQLCGYTDQQALHKTLQIIQGPKTDTTLAQRLVERLVATRQPQEGYLINYNQNGQSFLNHVTMGWMFMNNDTPQAELLVGILEPVR